MDLSNDLQIPNFGSTPVLLKLMGIWSPITIEMCGNGSIWQPSL